MWNSNGMPDEICYSIRGNCILKPDNMNLPLFKFFHRYQASDRTLWMHVPMKQKVYVTWALHMYGVFLRKRIK